MYLPIFVSELAAIEYALQPNTPGCPGMRSDQCRQRRLCFSLLTNELCYGSIVLWTLLPFLICDSLDVVHVRDDALVNFEFFFCKQIIGG